MLSVLCRKNVSSTEEFKRRQVLTFSSLMGICPRAVIGCGRFWSGWLLFRYSSNWSGLTHILPLRLLWPVSTTLLQVPLPSWLWYHCRRNLGWRNEWIWKDEFGASSVFNITWQGGLAPKDLCLVAILLICAKTMFFVTKSKYPPKQCFGLDWIVGPE